MLVLSARFPDRSGNDGQYGRTYYRVNSHRDCRFYRLILPPTGLQPASSPAPSFNLLTLLGDGEEDDVKTKSHNRYRLPCHRAFVLCSQGYA